MLSKKYGASCIAYFWQPTFLMSTLAFRIGQGVIIKNSIGTSAAKEKKTLVHSNVFVAP
jgi:hypothetical protein